jgi:hypothetical protein
MVIVIVDNGIWKVFDDCEKSLRFGLCNSVIHAFATFYSDFNCQRIEKYQLGVVFSG